MCPYTVQYGTYFTVQYGTPTYIFFKVRDTMRRTVSSTITGMVGTKRANSRV